MTQSQPQFAIETIQTLGSSFRAKSSWSRLNKKWEPNANFHIDLNHEKYGDDQYEVSLVIKVNVTQDNEEIFEVVVKQVGTFRLSGYKDEEENHLLESFCPTLLFPYARQVISDHVTRSLYPPFHCPHVDFEARYRGKKEEKQGKVT